MLDTFEIGSGTRLADRYEVIARLGSGGMATVFLAEDEVLGRKVAVKRLRGDSEADVARFRREARLGATMSHPNLVTIFDTIAGDEGVLIVMEYVPGETLARALDRGALEPDRAIEVLRAVAAALDHAHAQGVVHRDVKPANVLLGEDGAVKLADLGIATAAQATRITTSNDIVGTLAYVAPERLDTASPGGPEADVYGLAVLAYEALGGEDLNRGSTPAEVVHRASTAPPPDLRDVWPGAPPAAVDVLKQALHRDPAARPSSAGVFVDRLEQALREDPGPPTEAFPAAQAQEAATDTEEFAAPPPPRPAAPTAETTSRGPRRALLALAAVALAAGVALAIVLAVGDDGGSGGERTRAANDQGRDQPAAANEDKPAAAEEEPAPEEEAPAPEEEPAADSEPTAATGDDPAALNDQGFQLIQEGDYDAAIPILQQAVDSYPEGSQDMTYAYALFNLGNALRLAGRPDEAIPILEQRLQIPDQTETVQQELDLAREEAGE